MTDHKTSTSNNISIITYFKPRAKNEIKEEQIKEGSLFNSDDDEMEPEKVEKVVEPSKLFETVLEDEISKLETTGSEHEIASTHYEESTVSFGDLDEEDALMNKKRASLFEDDAETMPKIKKHEPEDQVDELEDLNFEEPRKEVKEDMEEEDRLSVYQFNDKVETVCENLTVGKECKKDQEDSMDFSEREIYMNCKASQNSIGFRSYVDNYYRYKGTFLFPPWLEVKNIRDAAGKKPTDDDYNPGTVWIPPKNHRWAIQFKSGHYTECMQQWWNIKKDHFDTIVFFKMGRFYELFYHDACIIQSLVNLRWMGSETKPHVGFPEKSLHVYASACVKAGYRVVVVEQTETPQQLEKRNKESGTYDKAVKRDVCEIITPGTVSRPEMLGKQSRPLVLITSDTEFMSLVSIDVSMSKVRFGKVQYTPEFSQLKTVLVHLCPAEVVLEKPLMENKELLKSIRCMPYSPEITPHQRGNLEGTILYRRVLQSFSELADDSKDALLLAESYLKQILMEKLVDYSYLEPLNVSEMEVMTLDYSALTHLELFLTQEGSQKYSLFDYLNNTKTSFGERMLRNWLLNPLTDVQSINNRSECVAFLVQNFPLVTTLNEELEKFPDLERSLGKILNAASNYHKKAVYFDQGVYTKLYDLYTLLDKFQKLEDIILNFLNESMNLFSDLKSDLIKQVEQNFSRCSDDVMQFKSMLRLTGDRTCQSADWSNSKNLKVEIDNITGKLDELLSTIQKTSPSACFVNCKFRFEVEMTEAEFQRYQKKFKDMDITSTRSGFVRGRNAKIMQILEELEEAEFRLKESEEEFYQVIVKNFHENSYKFCKLIETAGMFDCLASLATVAKNSPFNMTRPVIRPKTENVLKVKDSVYPIFNISSSKFVPNDVCIGNFEDLKTPIVIITGPNMGGKSTLLRQIALTVIMGQIGSFVSASSCEFSVVDRVFTRLGASDNLLEGKSTFLVELQDISSILSKATNSSLALIDELGRGTSTFDGTAIAVATLEKISEIGCRCVFTTHFQDVCISAESFENVAMFHMAAKVDEETQNVEFLYKLVPGVCPDSHGLHVAKLARIPDHVIKLAKKASMRLKRDGCEDEEKNELLERLVDEVCNAHQNNDEDTLREIYNKYTRVKFD